VLRYLQHGSRLQRFHMADANQTLRTVMTTAWRKHLNDRGETILPPDHDVLAVINGETPPIPLSYPELAMISEKEWKRQRPGARPVQIGEETALLKTNSDRRRRNATAAKARDSEMKRKERLQQDPALVEDDHSLQPFGPDVVHAERRNIEDDASPESQDVVEQLSEQEAPQATPSQSREKTLPIRRPGRPKKRQQPQQEAATIARPSVTTDATPLRVRASHLRQAPRKPHQRIYD